MLRVAQRGGNKARYEKRAAIDAFESRIITQLMSSIAVRNPRLRAESLATFCFTVREHLRHLPASLRRLSAHGNIWPRLLESGWQPPTERQREILPGRLINNFANSEHLSQL